MQLKRLSSLAGIDVSRSYEVERTLTALPAGNSHAVMKNRSLDVIKNACNLDRETSLMV
jgi:hypothetical protein